MLRIAHAESEVQLYLDGEPLSPERYQRTGREHPLVWLSPGAHEFRATAEGFAEQFERVDLLEGEEHPLVISLTRADTAPTTEAFKPAPWIALGAGALGFAGFAYFGLSGLNKKGDLDACRTRCSAATVDAARRDFLLADASLLVGLIGTGLGVALLLSPAATPSKTETTRNQPHLRLQVAAAPGGASVWLEANGW